MYSKIVKKIIYHTILILSFIAASKSHPKVDAVHLYKTIERILHSNAINKNSHLEQSIFSALDSASIKTKYVEAGTG